MLFNKVIKKYIHTHIPTYIHTYINTYIHTHIHTYIYAYIHIKEETMQNWQKEWEDCTKAEITKKFFPKIKDRQKLKIEIIPIFTAMVTGHGKTRA